MNFFFIDDCVACFIYIYLNHNVYKKVGLIRVVLHYIFFEYYFFNNLRVEPFKVLINLLYVNVTKAFII